LPRRIARPDAQRLVGSQDYIRKPRSPVRFATIAHAQDANGLVFRVEADAVVAGAGRVSLVQGTLGAVNTQYASGIQYWPHGAIHGMTVGTKYEETCFNNRLQPVGIRLGAATTFQTCVNPGSDLLNLTLGYGPTNSNNGNLASQTIASAGLLSAVTQNYGYTDAFNRLTAASEGSNWRRAFGYDAFGNMWVASGSGVSVDPFSPSQDWINAANNRLVNAGQGIGYDNAGNQTSIGGFARTYDAENRLATSTLNNVPTVYGYDGDGRRVKRVQGSATTVYVYDAQGQLAAEYATQPETPPCTTCYLTADHLGSTRLMTDGTTGLPKALHDYLPFGEEIPAGIGGRSATYYPPSTLAINDATTLKFTGKERDAETGLDYFQTRYFSGAQGRFSSPDDPFADQHPADPQSWNLYGYVRNNPLAFTDPSGNACVQDSNGSWANDNSGGQSCEEVDEENSKWLEPSVTVTATYTRDDQIQMLANDVSDLTSTASVSEVVVNGMVGAQAAEGIAGLPGLFRSGWNLIVGWRLASKMARVQAAGETGEALANIVKNAERIPSVTGVAYRVPDILDHAGRIIGEVKNYTTTPVSLTAQLRDDVAYAARNGYTVVLKVREGAQLRQPVQQLVNQGVIKLIRF